MILINALINNVNYFKVLLSTKVLSTKVLFQKIR